MKRIAFLGFVAAICVAVAGFGSMPYSGAGSYCHPVQVQQQAYAAPVQQYAHPYNYVAPQVIQVPVQPEYYYSSNDAAANKLLADAITGRVAELMIKNNQDAANYKALLELVLRSNGTIQGGPPSPQMPPAVPLPVKNSNVDPQLVSYVSGACLKCHSGPAKSGGGLSLEDLARFGYEDRKAIVSQIEFGDMPKGGTPAPESIKTLFRAYAMAARP